MKTALLIISLCLLPTGAFTGIGIGGLVAWGLLTLLFRVADEGVEQMETEIQNGNQSGGCLWLGIVFVFVILGGLATMGAFLTVAGNLRGAF